MRQSAHHRIIAQYQIRLLDIELPAANRYDERTGEMTQGSMLILEQYAAAAISPWNNNWGHIHDFTSIPDSKNYSLLNMVRANATFVPLCDRVHSLLE